VTQGVCPETTLRPATLNRAIRKDYVVIPDVIQTAVANDAEATIFMKMINHSRICWARIFGEVFGC